MKIKTSELSGAALDYAVLVCEGRKPDRFATGDSWCMGRFNNGAKVIQRRTGHNGRNAIYRDESASTDWSQGGPIIERERIGLFFDRVSRSRWRASHHDQFADYLHESALVAGLRCFVALKLGDEVDVPEELLRT